MLQRKNKYVYSDSKYPIFLSNGDGKNDTINWIGVLFLIIISPIIIFAVWFFWHYPHQLIIWSPFIVGGLVVGFLLPVKK